MTAITFAVIAFIAVSGILVGWNALHAYISPGEFLRSYGVDLPGASSSSSALSQESSQSSMSASGSSLSSEDSEDSSIPPIPDLGKEIIPPIPNLSDIIDEMQSGSMSSSSESDLPIPDLGNISSSSSSVSSEEDTPTDLPIPDLGGIIQSSSSSEASSAATSSQESSMVSSASSEATQSSASSQTTEDTGSYTGSGSSTRNPQPVQDWPAPWRNITGGYDREPIPTYVPSEPSAGAIANTPTLTIESNEPQMPQAPAPATNPVPEMAAASVQPPAVAQQPSAIPESIAAMIPPSTPPLKAAAPAPLYDTAPGGYVPPSVTAPAAVPSQPMQPAIPPFTAPLAATVTETPTATEETSQNAEQSERAPLPGSGTPLNMILFVSPLLTAVLYALMRKRRPDASA
ncbi:TPA: hypothetical protein DCL30_04935 [Candidatus Peribacteria bacterium]|nr:MAG: hypothetical protein A2529_01230 [Candidatus Peribacteria bacterium RIFOXYD2_FULL_58_15]HAI98847.1 hypothetical protein [Candidatus Peribacteria bacterium]HAS33754.1 hypothetical protein [Candidatus Peribacteria bacterium]